LISLKKMRTLDLELLFLLLGILIRYMISFLIEWLWSLNQKLRGIFKAVIRVLVNKGAYMGRISSSLTSIELLGSVVRKSFSPNRVSCKLRLN